MKPIEETHPSLGLKQLPSINEYAVEIDLSKTVIPTNHSNWGNKESAVICELVARIQKHTIDKAKAQELVDELLHGFMDYLADRCAGKELEIAKHQILNRVQQAGLKTK